MPRVREGNKVYADDFNNLACTKLDIWKPESHMILHILSTGIVYLSLAKYIVNTFVLKVLSTNGYLYAIINNLVRCLNCQKSISSALPYV